MQKGREVFFSTAFINQKSRGRIRPWLFALKYVINSTHHRQTGAKVIIKTEKSACDCLHLCITLFKRKNPFLFFRFLYWGCVHVKHFLNRL
jgi:hypothetical protein